MDVDLTKSFSQSQSSGNRRRSAGTLVKRGSHNSLLFELQRYLLHGLLECRSNIRARNPTDNLGTIDETIAFL
jgi:hypothetical protein